MLNWTIYGVEGFFGLIT